MIRSANSVQADLQADPPLRPDHCIGQAAAKHAHPEDMAAFHPSGEHRQISRVGQMPGHPVAVRAGEHVIKPDREKTFDRRIDLGCAYRDRTDRGVVGRTRTEVGGSRKNALEGRWPDPAPSRPILADAPRKRITG